MSSPVVMIYYGALLELAAGAAEVRGPMEAAVSAMQKYEPHFDYFFHKEGTANGGNRYVTVLMYLSDVEEGGETVRAHVALLL